MRFRRQPLLCLAFFAALFPTSLVAQSWEAPARALAQTIVARTQSRSAIALSVENVSSLPGASLADIRRALEAQLRALGVNLVPPGQAAEEARVTLSENVSGYLWVAEIGHGDSWDVLMLPAGITPVAPRSAAPLTLRRSPLVSEPQRILDAAALDANTLLVLDSEQIGLYRLQNSRWQLRESAAIVAPRPWPRDLRGRITSSRDAFNAYLPGVLCTGATQPSLTAHCEEKDDPWPLSADPGASAFFGAARNFFNGALVPPVIARLPSFYSAAALPDSGRNLWVVAPVDGTARLLGPGGELLATLAGWGSDLTVVRGSCGAHVLATRPGDNSGPDAIQAYEIANRQAAEAGLPIEFSGPVTALWPAADNASAVAVSVDARSGWYEAFIISISCSR